MPSCIANQYNSTSSPANLERRVTFIRAQRLLPRSPNLTPPLPAATIWCAMRSRQTQISPSSIYLPGLGSGFDIVSGGELHRVLKAGGNPRKIVFSGVGKRPDEMRAALTSGILCFNVESAAELKALNRVARDMNKIAPVSLRVNPDVDAKTHPYISTGLKENKFGIPFEEAETVYISAQGLANIHVTGLDCHIGSQLTELDPFVAACGKMLGLLDRLEARGLQIDHLDLGGGLGISYSRETPPLAAGIRGCVTRLCRSPQAAHPHRTRPCIGGKCRFTAHPGRVSETYSTPGFRHCRRGDERSVAPGPL